MMNRLMEKLQTFTDRLDQGIKCTNAIKASVQNQDWNGVEQNTNNRERLLGIIAQEQTSIEAIINMTIVRVLVIHSPNAVTLRYSL